MKESLSKELHACFKKEIEARLCQFKPIVGDLSPWKWEWRMAEKLTFFLLLQPIEDLDQFTVEVAWSESGEFPWKGFGKKKPDRASGRLRLPDLWAQGAVEFLWDLDPAKTAAKHLYWASLRKETALPVPQDSPDKEVLPRMRTLVCDAVDKLEQYGIPLFRQVGETRGIEL